MEGMKTFKGQLGYETWKIFWHCGVKFCTYLLMEFENFSTEVEGVQSALQLLNSSPSHQQML